MKKRVQTTKRNISSFALLLVLMFNICSTTLFVHIHHTDEATIAHSHPFTGKPESHHHSSTSFNHIARQVISEMRIAETTPLNQVDNFIEVMQSIDVVVSRSQQSLEQRSLRAPPVA